MRPGLCALWILLECFLAACRGLAISSEAEPVNVELQGAMAGVWAVHQASVQEDYTGMFGVVELKNVSTVAVVDAAFYGDYFDASGRFCFAALFAQDENNEGRTGPFLPGEVRRLRTTTFYVNPASRPTRLKLSSLSDPILDDRGEIRGGGGLLAPPALESVGLRGNPWERIWLGQELESAQGPLLDLVLARIGVDTQGLPRDVEIMSSVSPSVRSWFEEFIHHQRFRPATIGSEAQEGDVLLFVRALVSLRCIRQKPWPPRESPAVREYVARQAGKYLLPVITIPLHSVSPDFWKQLTSDYFEILDVGSDWGVTAHPAPEREVPAGPARPPSRAIVPPAEAYACP